MIGWEVARAQRFPVTKKAREHRECPSDGNGGINVKKSGCTGIVLVKTW